MKSTGLLAAPPQNFQSASREVIRFLRKHLGFDLWMVTRKEGDDWIVLQAEDHGYGVRADTVFRWADSFCSRMIAGQGPRMAPDSNAVPAYAEAPIGKQVKIGAYVGVPLTFDDGTLFGTLCAIDPDPKPPSIAEELPLTELLAAMLSSILNAELKLQQAERSAERARNEAETDAMTNLHNRRGWDRLLKTEDARCRRYGHAASVLVVDLDRLKTVNDRKGHSAGDELICRAAQALRTETRESDIVARTGGDEFAVLAAECDFENARVICQRIQREMERVGIAASLGVAMRHPAKSLQYAWEEADKDMYRNKASRRAE